ncbi:hypothetical protein BTEBP_10219 [Brochothrix thermosphacta]|nr:hypothetical protein BTEBP_10219 [Brochothrix thermosphacta]
MILMKMDIIGRAEIIKAVHKNE